MLIAIFNLGGPFVRWPRRPAYLPWMQLKLEMLAKPSQLTADPGAITEKLWNRDDPGTYINTSSWWHIWSRKQSAACTKHTNRLCVIRSLMLLKGAQVFRSVPRWFPDPPNADFANLRMTRVTWSSLVQMAAPETVKPPALKSLQKVVIQGTPIQDTQKAQNIPMWGWN